MANTKSARKRAAKSALQREKNRAARSRVRTLVKKARATGAGAEALSTAVSALDAATSKGLVHKNTAARTKSRLAKAAKKSAAK